MIKFVKCICNYRREKELSINKVYEVVGITPLCYRIIADTSRTISCTKDRFEVVKNNEKANDTSKKITRKINYTSKKREILLKNFNHI